MKISLLHPSRGRPLKAYQTANEWLNSAGCYCEYLLSIDSSDPEHNRYEYLFQEDYPVFINNNNSLVEATNVIAKIATGDILVYLSDDFKCFPDWGKILQQEFAKYQGPTLLKVDDCLQKFEVAVLTIPIMNRACYEALGYFFHPDFRSMHCDEHLYWRTMKLGFLKFAPHIKFEHCHVSVGKAEDDDTYRRSAANWNHGVSTLAKHKKMGFIS